MPRHDAMAVPTPPARRITPRDVPIAARTPRDLEAVAGPTRRTPRDVDALPVKPPPKLKRAARPRRAGPPRTVGQRLLRLAIALAALSLVGGLAGIAFAFVWYGSDPALPNLVGVADYRPPVGSRVVDRDGELIGEIFDERRTVVATAKIPALMTHAIVDAEDAQFYEHRGLNYVGMLRAFLNNLRPGAHLQGGSTITQQLVKTYLLKTNERTLKRKVQEVILARRLESRLSKDDILTIYLNQIYFGHNRYGVEEAARFYFGKGIAEVNAGEAAVLASLPKGPEEISPLKHPERAKDRQCYVLRRMVENGHLAQKDAEQYCKAPIQVVKAAESVGGAPEFVDEARRRLSERYGQDQLGGLGLTVKSTCDSRIQRLARSALEKGLEGLDERQGYRRPVDHLKSVEPEAIKRALERRALHRLGSMIDHPSKSQQERWLSERANALAAGKVFEGVVVEVVAQGTAGRTPGVLIDAAPDRGFLPLPVVEGRRDRYNPKGLAAEKRFAVGDVIPVRSEPSLGPAKQAGGVPTLVPELGPQAAVVVLDPQTREVLAMVGGYEFHPGGFNRATQAKRQPGSAFKPFLYAAAFNSGKYTPASILNDSPQVYELPGLREWKPKNAESHEFLGPVRLRTALAKSLNTVASQLVADLGPEAVAQLATAAGIDSKLEATLALGLGASAVSLTELTNAYATLDSFGRRGDPVVLTEIGGEVEPRHEPQAAMTPEVAYLTTSIMESVIDEGTAASAKGKLRRPAAGKTGTTSSERDAWFVGFTPDLVVGVWVGFDDMRDLGRGEQGARSALPIWVDTITGALKGSPPRPFLQPPGIQVARIDPATGLLAAPTATNAIEEKFLAGTAPTEVAPEKGAENPDTFLLDQAQ